MAKIIKDINNPTRVRHFDIVFYAGVDELLRIIHYYRSRIQRYAFIEHLYDVYEEDLIDEKTKEFIHRKGEIKKPHIHLVISFYNNCTLRACSRLFTTENDKPRVYSIGDMIQAYNYLIHKDNPEKYQYKKCDITSDDLSYYEKLLVQGEKSDSDNKSENIVMDILAGVPTRVMISRYGRDFVIHMSQYVDCANKIRTEDLFAENKRLEREAVKKLEELPKAEQEKMVFKNEE